MTNLYRSRLNYSYAVVKIQAGGDPLHPSSRSGCLLFQACFRVVLEVGLASTLSGSANPENDTDETLTALGWNFRSVNSRGVLLRTRLKMSGIDLG